ncbi:type II toxin-antitoxin system Phd/YefM family antitoxin [Streptomyces sp. x-80]|uniref:type II toxin-antitoxin system Phd/YefM family antitoxin n=1 Tax=Streptomyces sp. x-80 TaxID=2789282 RepID=UPI00397EDB9A
MREIRVREARAHLTELLAAAADGEGTRITRHGRAVAVLLRPGAAAALSPDQRKHQRNRILQEP